MLKKRKIFFGKKLQIFEFFFSRKMSHSHQKCKRGAILELLTYILLQNIKKLEGGPVGDIKKFSKMSHNAEKSRKGAPSVSSGFVGFLEKLKKMKRGPFGLSLLWLDLALGGFRIVLKKWTDQCEDCSLKKQAGNGPSRRHI